jgi:hypothetical protein
VPAPKKDFFLVPKSTHAADIPTNILKKIITLVIPGLFSLTFFLFYSNIYNDFFDLLWKFKYSPSPNNKKKSWKPWN